jgi:lipase chaperone LimK
MAKKVDFKVVQRLRSMELAQEKRINKFYAEYYKKKSHYKPSQKLTPEERQAEIDRRYKDR